eukprot:TRINITY_DN12265_c0_g1_i1.p1 TRINITY_DN12265_c0_g1~~TRINITY_DN12265_c0_g1_i1.p1  ORF type:complete len:436 (+),score=65.84 TRINITY_DN12265_c0_g1_i1:78-1385(+)
MWTDSDQPSWLANFWGELQLFGEPCSRGALSCVLNTDLETTHDTGDVVSISVGPTEGGKESTFSLWGIILQVDKAREILPYLVLQRSGETRWCSGSQLKRPVLGQELRRTLQQELEALASDYHEKLQESPQKALLERNVRESKTVVDEDEDFVVAVPKNMTIESPSSAASPRRRVPSTAYTTQPIDSVSSSVKARPGQAAPVDRAIASAAVSLQQCCTCPEGVLGMRRETATWCEACGKPFSQRQTRAASQPEVQRMEWPVLKPGPVVTGANATKDAHWADVGPNDVISPVTGNAAPEVVGAREAESEDSFYVDETPEPEDDRPLPEEEDDAAAFTSFVSATPLSDAPEVTGHSPDQAAPSSDRKASEEALEVAARVESRTQDSATVPEADDVSPRSVESFAVLATEQVSTLAQARTMSRQQAEEPQAQPNSDEL